MKSLVLAVTVAAGLLCSATSADAQYRYRRGAAVYSTPTYSSYSYPTYSYSYPTYSYSTPMYYDSGVVTSSYYTPTYTYPSGAVITTGGYYDPSLYAPTYSYPMYSSYPYSTGSYYNGGYYNGLNVTPSGAYMGGRRIWRW